MWSPDNSITGGAQTNFTTPVFVTVSGTALVVNAIKKVITSITGTVGTAVANSALLPFFGEFTAPAVLKSLPPANPLTGLRGSVPNNVYKYIVQKGGYCAAGVPGRVTFELLIKVSAGMETYAPDDVRAAVSYFVGSLNEESADLGDTLVAGFITPQ